MRKKRKDSHIRKLKTKENNKREFVYRPFEEVLKDSDNISTLEGHFEEKKVDEISEKNEDEYLFEQAMKGVTPLKDTKKKVITSEIRKETTHNLSKGRERQAREYLLSLVKEPGAWDVSFSDEYMEGSVSGISVKTMKKLRRGDFSVQDYIDLHGLTKKDAESVVNQFLINSHNKGLRCVLIVHGRGLGSVDNQPAIKKELPIWFRRGLLKKIVLAFATARPYDGGTGALYVLLKTR